MPTFSNECILGTVAIALEEDEPLWELRDRAALLWPTLVWAVFRADGKTCLKWSAVREEQVWAGGMALSPGPENLRAMISRLVHMLLRQAVQTWEALAKVHGWTDDD